MKEEEKQNEKYKKKEPSVGTYAPKKEENPEKKPFVQKTEKQSGTVICVKAGTLIINVKGNGVSILKTAKHKDVQAGDKIEV